MGGRIAACPVIYVGFASSAYGFANTVGKGGCRIAACLRICTGFGLLASGLTNTIRKGRMPDRGLSVHLHAICIASFWICQPYRRSGTSDRGLSAREKNQGLHRQLCEFFNTIYEMRPRIPVLRCGIQMGFNKRKTGSAEIPVARRSVGPWGNVNN